MPIYLKYKNLVDSRTRKDNENKITVAGAITSIQFKTSTKWSDQSIDSSVKKTKCEENAMNKKTQRAQNLFK